MIAERLGESVIETKRLMSMIADVKLRGRPQRRTGGSRVQGGNAPANGDPSTELDVPALCDFYREQRTAGRGPEQAVKATARQFNQRPHVIRQMVGVTEYKLRHPPDSSH